MSVFFNAKEVAELGVEIEKNGELFYKEAINKSTKNEVRCLLEWLAAEERLHRSIFEEIVKDIEKRKRLHESPDLEAYQAYLKDLADSHIFRNTEGVKEMLGRTSSAEEVLDTALKFEKDSILLFEQMKKVTPPDLGQKEIDRLIQEETNHIHKISELKRKLSEVK